MVLVVPKDNPTNIESFDDVLSDKVSVIGLGDPESTIRTSVPKLAWEESIPLEKLFLAHDAWLFIVLALFHFRKNACFLNLLFEAAQGKIEIVIIFVQEYPGQYNHLP